MEQELKDLLLKDLCVRLPYGVMCKASIPDLKTDTPPKEAVLRLTSGMLNYIWIDYRSLRPYLRPIHSMTEEEKKDYELLCDYYMDDKEMKYYFNNIATIDWYHQKHFDCRGLIKLGLALEAPDGMYK